MPALITTAIGQQNFEKVRDAIGAILLVELTNQKALQPTVLPETLTIWRECVVPVPTDDFIYINVRLLDANYASKTQSDTQGKTMYAVDFYTTGQANTTMTGSEDSGTRLHKYMGKCRYILNSTFYKTLGFVPGTIGGCLVESLQTDDQPTHFEDGNYTRFGRLTFSVRIMENQSLWDGVAWNQSNTTVKIADTEHGYQFISTAD